MKIAIIAVISCIVLLLSIIILIGKGDGLIARYNTASEKERAQINIKRLRTLVAGLLGVVCVFLWIPAIFEQKEFLWGAIIIMLMIVRAVVFLANSSWCKKKEL